MPSQKANKIYIVCPFDKYNINGFLDKIKSLRTKFENEVADILGVKKQNGKWVDNNGYKNSSTKTSLNYAKYFLLKDENVKPSVDIRGKIAELFSEFIFDLC